MTNKGYINLDDTTYQEYQPPAQTANTQANTIIPPRPSNGQGGGNQNFNFDPPSNSGNNNSSSGSSQHNPSASNSSDPSHLLKSELSSVEDEMLRVAESAFNRQRDQAHRDIDQLYDRLIDTTRSKVQGLTSDVMQEVTREN